MKHKMLLFFALVFLVFIAVPVLAQDALVLPTPTLDPAKFADELPDTVVYHQEDENCRGNDGSVLITDVTNTCSTWEQQEAVGEFDLSAFETRVATGALPVFLEAHTEGKSAFDVKTDTSCWNPDIAKALLTSYSDGKWDSVYPDLCKTTNVRPYVVVLTNNTKENKHLVLAEGFGLFWGDIGIPIIRKSWTVDEIVSIRDTHTKKMVFENKAVEDAWLLGTNPYPTMNPANCSAVADLTDKEVTYCAEVNVVTAIWDGKTWTLTLGVYGLTEDGFTYLDVAPLLSTEKR